MNCWQADAYSNLKILLTTSTLPKMFDLCPPFQIGGNLGRPAAMMEILVQSDGGEIGVLPALPRQWWNGSLRGVRVRGGGKVDITWNEGRLIQIKVQSDRTLKYRVRYGGESAEIQLAPDKPVVLDGALRRKEGH